jgi:hypothetical protein
LDALERMQSVQISDKVIAQFQEKIQNMRNRILTLQSQSQGQDLDYLNKLIQGYEKTIKSRGGC